MRKKMTKEMMMALAVLVISGSAGIAAQKGESGDLTLQKTCPVMGNPIDKDLFVDMSGHRIYVCCPPCLARVEAEPQKYVQKLAEMGQRPKHVDKGKKICSGGTCSATLKKKGPQPDRPLVEDAPTISMRALKLLKKSDTEVTILDARGGSKWDDGRRIPGAKGLSVEATPEEAAKVIPSKESLVVTYCVSVNCPASRMLKERLKEFGYTRVIEAPEGIYGWADVLDYDIEKVSPDGDGA